MTSLLSNIGRSLLVSCMIPAIVFVTVSLLIFVPSLPSSLLSQFGVIAPSNQADFAGVLAIILVVAFMLAYVLKVMNWAVVRLFEGYYLPFAEDILRDVQTKRKARFAKRVSVEKQMLNEEKEGTRLYQQKWRRYMDLKNEYLERFPHQARDVLPTQLGNVYRAFEDYPFRRYGMEGLFFWERLAKFIPEDYAGKIEELNNSVSFLLNSSLASFIVAGEIIIKDIFAIDGRLLDLVLNTRPLSFQILLSFLRWEFPSTKILFSLLCLGLSYFFYYAAVSTAMSLGRYIRTCYDLFRMELLEELNVAPPNVLGSQEEKALWRSVHEFLALGEASPYEKDQSKHALPALDDILQPIRDFVWLSVQLKLWQSVSFLLERFTASADRSRFRSRYVVLNDGAE